MHIGRLTPRAWGMAPAWLVVAALLLALNALTAKLNHDESQYVAGAILAGSGMEVFKSFMSLQPPLQTWIYAPVAALFHADAFIALRLFSAALATLTLALVHSAQRALGVPPATALLTTGLMGCCGAFLMTSAVVRNDMLAAVLVSGGMVALLPASGKSGGTLRWGIGGLCFGLALSTKLSFAPYGLFAILHLLMGPRRLLVTRLGGYSLGAAVGAAPLVACTVAAPGAVLWGVLTYATIAPFDHYAAIGHAARLGTLGKLLDLARYALQGPLLAAAVIVGIAAARGRLALPDASRRLLLLLLLGGIAGAALPTPTQKQYLLPILPPLFVLLGTTLSQLALGRRQHAAWLAVLGAFAVVGLATPARAFAKLRHGTPDALALDARAAWIGAALRHAGDAGSVATLSPERIAGSGYGINPHFATGPFVLRSGHLLPDTEALRLHVATPTTVDDVLGSSPPAGLLSGYEPRSGEAVLVAWAARHGYRGLRLPDGVGTLYICPGVLERGLGCRAS